MSPDQLLPGTDETIGSLRQSLSTIRLPIENNQREKLVAMMAADQLSLHELAQHLLRVPVAALEVCRVAGQAARSRDIDILTLEQACGLLGTQRVANLLKQLPVVDPAQMPPAFLQMLSISEHALAQAKGLFSQRMARLWHEMALGSLLFTAPFWALVYHRPELFAQWDRLHLEPARVGPAERQAAKGGPFLALAQQLAEDWWLPPWIVQGYRSLGSTRRTMVKSLHIARDSAHPREQQAALDGDKALYRWLTQPANGLLLANGLALGAHHDWHARHTGRWQQLTALYLGCRLEQAQAASHECAAEHARACASKAGQTLWLPAEALLWPDMSRAVRRPASPESPEPIPVEKPTPVNPAAWREHCARLTQTPSPFANVPTMLAEALRALTEGLGVKRCWIALYNARRKQLVIGASFGIGQRLAGTRLGALRDAPWGDWLASAPSHPVGPAQQALLQAWPAEVLETLSGAGCRLLPLNLGGQMAGVLMAEFDTAAELPRTRQVPALEKTRDCLEKALLAFKSGS